MRLCYYNLNKLTFSYLIGTWTCNQVILHRFTTVPTSWRTFSQFYNLVNNNISLHILQSSHCGFICSRANEYQRICVLTMSSWHGFFVTFQAGVIEQLADESQYDWMAAVTLSQSCNDFLISLRYVQIF